jgi:HPt (histidine-containing phosphotransfer) domain-containing protein
MLVLSGCVGPARTTHTYESKAVRTANDSVSQLQTALLSVETSLRGRMMHADFETVLSASEDALSSIQNTFDSIQPPETDRADQLRNRLDTLLSDGADGLAQLRILARRQDTHKLAAEAHKLTAQAAVLEKFALEDG